MKPRRVYAAFAFLMIAAIVAACGGAPASPTAAPKFKMGLITPGPVNDNGWNATAYAALMKIHTDLGADVANVEVTDAASYEKAFRDYANQGFNVILAHGNEYEPAAEIVAKDYPNVQFFISSSRLHETNITGLNSDASQPFYLMGVIAAMMGKKAGLVGGIEIPPLKESFQGFINGAKSVNPNFPVSAVYTGSFTDVAAAKEAAVTLIQGGADFVVGNADAAGLGVYQAVADTNGKVKTFGVFGDFKDKTPQSELGYFTADYGAGIVRVIKSVQDGTYKGGQNFDFGLKDPDVIVFNYNDALKGQIPADVLKAVDDAKTQIIAGKINTLAP